jgi:hypothetical protein
MADVVLIAGVSLVLAAAPVQTLMLPASPPPEPLVIECPVGRPTLLVFPERLELVHRQPNDGPIEVKLQQSRPEGIVSIRPREHPSRLSLTFRGPTLVVRVQVQSLPPAAGTEARIVESPPVGRPPVEPPPVVNPPLVNPPVASAGNGEAPAPIPSPAPPSRTVPDPPAAGLFDLQGLVRARFVPIGRLEGLPGQQRMILVDASAGEAWVWMHFELERGARRRVTSVRLNQTPVPAFDQEPDGKNLRVFVQIPRALFTSDARMVLNMADRESYTFAKLSSGRLGDVLKELFK